MAPRSSSSSFSESTRKIACWLLLASLLPFLLPPLALCSSFLLLLFFPLACAFLFLAVFRSFFSALLSALRPFVPLWISHFASLALLFLQNTAACIDGRGAEGFPYTPLEPVEDFQEVGPDGRARTLPAGPASGFEDTDVCFTSRNAPWASLDEKPGPDHHVSAEKMPYSRPTRASEVETATEISPNISSFLSEADKQKQIAQETPQDDREEQFLKDSIEGLCPRESEPPSVRERPDEISTSESRQSSNPGIEVSEHPEGAIDETIKLESLSEEATDTKEAENVSDATTLQGTDQKLISKCIQDIPGLRREELLEHLAQDVSGECETTLSHPDWKDESPSDHEVENIPETELSHAEQEQGFKLRYEIPECADVPQRIGVESMDLSVLEHREGFKPTAREDIALSEVGLGFAPDCLSASDNARPAGTYSGADDELSTRTPQEDAPEKCEEQAFKPYNTGEESDIKSSEDELSPETCALSSKLGGVSVSESEIESRKHEHNEDHSEAETSNRETSVVNLIKEPTGDTPIKVRSSKEINMLKDIDAIKKILGYQEDLRGCLVEQIRALYVFVGMEPNFSVVKGDDLEEAWEELEVLKGVIGLE